MAQHYCVIEEHPNGESEHGRDAWTIWDTTQEPAGREVLQQAPPEWNYEQIAAAVRSIDGIEYQIEPREESERRHARLHETEQEMQLEFSLEIERDPTKDIAQPIIDKIAATDGQRAAEAIAEVGDPRHKVMLELQREEEKRRRRQARGETSKDTQIEAPKQVKTESAAERKPQARGPEERRPDRSFPDDIQRRFYIRADHRGDQHVYADAQGKREVFQESGDKLRTKVNDAHAIKLMLDTAAHRGWSSINVKGTQEFRHEAWLEGQARGIAVTGYKPTEFDLQDLKNREEAYLRNEIVPAGVRAITRDRPQTVARDMRRSSPALRMKGTTGQPNREEEPGAPNEHTRADRTTSDYGDGLEGILVEQGSRPYKDSPHNDPSPYVTLQDDQGERHTAWGVALPDAMLKSGARKGDYVRIREAGTETITRNVLREINGQTVRVPQDVQRRAWDAEVLQERKARRVLDQADHERQSSEDRLNLENAANRDVGWSASSAERTLHVGPGRDAALKADIHANEARAKEYMASGRIVAGRTPALKNAAALEAYVERKVRQKYPNDPVVVQGAMQTARNKISHSLARGRDLPLPRVVEMRDFGDQARQDRDQQSSQLDQSQELGQSDKRKQNGEQRGNQGRSRQ